MGAALATFGDLESSAFEWEIATIVFASFTTVLMKTLGVWWAKTFKSPPLTIPFNIATLACLASAQWFLYPWLTLRTAAASTAVDFSWLEISTAIPIGFGQVFLADRLTSGLLILLAVTLCTPLGALVGLAGGIVGTAVGLLLGIVPETLFSGLWGYNAVLTAMAIGGVFYAPTGRSILIGAIAAVLSALLGGLLVPIFSALGLPILTVPFCLVTVACFVALQRSLPSVVPVALHAITSPEEHWRRYRAAKSVITNFRQQLY